LRNNSDLLALRDWLSADGDARAPSDPGLKEGFGCDSAACIARLSDGAVVSIARTAHGVAEDCDQASLVITPREAPPDCRALTIDRRKLNGSGSIVLRRAAHGWSIEQAVPPSLQRPWAHNANHDRSTPARTPASDATPRTEDLGTDD
jgi:competence protein ComEC